jgi:methionyl-tRNA synthetase
MNNFYSNNGIGLGVSTWIHGHGLVLLLVIVWSLFWKGLALWHSGRRGQPWWFIILLIVNTVGILEIIYLFAVLKLKPSKLFSK